MREGLARVRASEAGDVIIMHPALRRMCDRFPLLREQATVRFFGDEAFRDMCEDYDSCAATLTHLQSSDPPRVEMLGEYTALLLRLERELLRHLGEPMPHGES